MRGSSLGMASSSSANLTTTSQEEDMISKRGESYRVGSETSSGGKNAGPTACGSAESLPNSDEHHSSNLAFPCRRGSRHVSFQESELALVVEEEEEEDLRVVGGGGDDSTSGVDAAFLSIIETDEDNDDTTIHLTNATPKVETTCTKEEHDGVPNVDAAIISSKMGGPQMEQERIVQGTLQHPPTDTSNDGDPDPVPNPNYVLQNQEELIEFDEIHGAEPTAAVLWT
eukprot:CAMPEP_0172471158 /NCGR_PEP_ID=MMETSP1065-20121228/67674_1 /TAXON_ID=265537 /ORGANISM="Amphiprora paludosa, Strain CCMP125" /LENGTH=226 /DNA_ID=CAMNT_0013229247 /DNA_START=296 /DNA_END=976 /DNA_ORIENTATION=-